MSFLKRFIDVDITLNAGFFSDSTDTISLKGHRVNCVIRNPGGYNSGTMQCAIYGLSQRYMNQLTFVGINQRQNVGNLIKITAGTIDKNGKRDSGAAFIGTITAAWADYNQQPDVMFNVVAQGGYPFYLNPVQASSFEGDVDIPTIMSSLAKEQGYQLDNQGISGFATDKTLTGNTIDKIQQMSLAYNFNYKIDDINQKLIIYPMDGYIPSQDIPLVSPKTGMIGYPTFNESGVFVECLYNRGIRNGERVKVESSLESANGQYLAGDVLHSIESENNQGGAWFTAFKGFRAYANQSS